MASFRIHEDQENLNEPRRPQRLTRTTKATEAAQQPKRSVLAVVNKNQPRTQSQKPLKQEAASQASTQGANFVIHEDDVEENKQFVSDKNRPIVGDSKKPFVADENRPIVGDSKKPVVGDAKKPPVGDVKKPLEGNARKPLTVRNARPKLKKTGALSKAPANLLPSITSLHRPPLQEIAIPMTHEVTVEETDDEYSGSPMVLDTSVETIILRAEDMHIKPTLEHLLECQEYKVDILQYLLEAETRNGPKAFYMKKQPDISYSMRSILVDWLVEVAEEYNLQTETLYLAVGYIDRFLSFMSVVRAKLQLVGTAAMFIASKYEEIYPPDVGEFVYITDDTYTKKQVLRMEHLILKVLSFDLSRPTTLCFIVNFCASTKVGEKIQFLAMYISELSLLAADPFLKYVPSMVAASCIALARYTMCESHPWSNELQLVTQYSYAQLIPCIQDLKEVYHTAPDNPQQAVREKYRSGRRHSVADITPRHAPIASPTLLQSVGDDSMPSLEV